MFSIGEFAALGRVSVRMLRHYDAIGLLVPAAVDPSTGYRRYSAAQLPRLNRLVALKELGFPLDQLGPVLDDAVDAEQLRGMYRLRAAELTARIDGDRARLARVHARLRIVESESVMPDVTVRPVPAVTVACRTAVAAGLDNTVIGPVIDGLFGELGGHCGSGGLVPVGPGVAAYRPTDDGEGLVCTVGLPVDLAAGTTGAPDEVEVTTLPALEDAAVAVHEGPYEELDAVYQQLAAWVEDQGWCTDGSSRETYLVTHPAPPEQWRTEVALPITAR